MSKCRGILVGKLILGFLAITTHAQAEGYNAAPVQRIALVVANSDYTHAPKLLGAAEDLKVMSKTLASLHFDVMLAEDVRTKDDFYKNHLEPFRRRIKEGSFVVVYFSGHGVSAGGSSYFLPTAASSSIADEAGIRTLISENVLREKILDQRPAFLLMLFDACRGYAGSSTYQRISASGMDPKAFAALDMSTLKGTKSATYRLDDGISVEISYSSADGAPSVDLGAGKASHYTRAVASSLPLPDLKFSDLKSKIRFSMIKSGAKQDAWYSDLPGTYVRFNPSDAVKRDWKEAFQAAISAGSIEEVEGFLFFEAVSDYAIAARAWLEEHRKRLEAGIASIPHTQVSPLSPELAWSGIGGPSVVVARAFGDVGLRRTLSLSTVQADRAMASAWPPQTEGGVEHFTAELLATHGDALVLSQKLTTRTSPSSVAPQANVLSYGTPLDIRRIVNDREGKPWIEAVTGSSKAPVYAPLVKAETVRTVKLGKPIIEQILPPKPNGLELLVDETVVQAALAKIAAEGKKVSWASIASPKLPDQREQKLVNAQATHARYVLMKQDVPRGIITTVAGLDLPGKNVRMRLFAE